MNVLVKVFEVEEQKKDGLFMASTTKVKPMFGVSVAVGTCKIIPEDIKVSIAVQSTAEKTAS